MSITRSLFILIVMLTVFLSRAQATVIQTWDLTNKTPGALGFDYGLRLNGLESSLSTGDILIFDFEHANSSMMMSLVDTGGNLELKLSGTSFGAEFDHGYGSAYDGLYDINFTWVDVEKNMGGYDMVAEFGKLSSHSKGAGFGSVKGQSADTAFSVNALDLFSFNGKYDDTLDFKYGRNPEVSAWLTYNTTGSVGDKSGHAGDFGFSTVAVPEPSTLAIFTLGVMGLAASRFKRQA